MGVDDHEIRLTEKGSMGIHLNMSKDFSSYAAVIAQMKFIVTKNNTKVPFMEHM
jgi:hypothetical protein